jgi:nucleoside-diphosphate-sugar epimerase
MRILITGANGFIGEYLYEALKANGHEVQTVTRNSEPKFGNKNIACDLEQKSNLDQSLLNLQNILVERIGKKVPILIGTNKNLTDPKIEVIVRF